MSRRESSLKIGTRGSPLALVQADEVRRRLAASHAGLAADGAIEIVAIRTTGDGIRAGLAADSGGKGTFTKEIEAALLAGEIDVAVHSMKDVPTSLPDGLAIDCFLPREDPRDALVAPGLRAPGLDALPAGATVGTASPRRRAVVLNRRPDLKVAPLRGNVDTRLRKVAGGEADAILLAAAGLSRLGRRDVGAVPLDPDVVLPAACQGIVGVERRAGDERAAALLRPLNDPDAEAAAAAERALLRRLDGSCRTPIGALATRRGGALRLRAMIAAPDGSALFESAGEGSPDDPAALGAARAEALLAAAGPEILHG